MTLTKKDTDNTCCFGIPPTEKKDMTMKKIRTLFAIFIAANLAVFVLVSQKYVSRTPVEMRGIAQILVGIGIMLGCSMMFILILLSDRDD